MPLTDTDKKKAEIVQSGDYLNFFCTQCQRPCAVEYLGLYGGVTPRLKVECRNCGVIGVGKLNLHSGFVKADAGR